MYESVMAEGVDTSKPSLANKALRHAYNKYNSKIQLCIITEYKITVGLRPFYNQSIGLTDQTCNHLAIYANQLC